MEKTGNPASNLSSLPWSVPVAVTDIPDSGLHIKLDAPAETRAELAELAAVRDLPRLSAEFNLTRRGAKVHVEGQISAVVGQTCVVTLEPIEKEVAEPVHVVFAPPAPGVAARKAELAGDEVEIDAEQPDPPDPLVDGKVDLGAVATEFLVLAIDPYPRKAGVQFAPPKVDDAGAHPFAALAALKKPDKGGQS